MPMVPAGGKQFSMQAKIFKGAGCKCKAGFPKTCRDPGSNWGPPDLQSDALPTEPSRLAQKGPKPGQTPAPLP